MAKEEKDFEEDDILDVSWEEESGKEKMSWKALSKKADKERKDMQRTFRDVFSSEDGRKVFNIILNDLYFFQKAKSEGDTALSNYAKFLIQERMGLNDTISMTNLMLKSKFEE